MSRTQPHIADLIVLLTDLEIATGNPIFAEARDSLIHHLADLMNRDLVLRLRGVTPIGPPPPYDIEVLKKGLDEQ